MKKRFKLPVNGKILKQSNILLTRAELTTENEEEVEIGKRIDVSKQGIFSLLPIIKSPLAHRKDKLRIYRTLIQPSPSYGCEAWRVTQSSEKRLSISEIKMSR
jgi:hypothetical protein